MPARIIFIITTVAAAFGCAIAAGLITAVIGLSAKMPPADLITAAAGTAAAVFGGVIALSGIAAGLFFTTPPTDRGNLADPPAGQPVTGSKPPAVPGPGTSRDQELRAAVRASTLLPGAAQAGRRGHEE